MGQYIVFTPVRECRISVRGSSGEKVDNLNVVTVEPALRYDAINAGDIQFMEVYSTDPEIERYQLQILEDDQHLFPPYQGEPLTKAELLEKYPKLEAFLNTLAGNITESQMNQLNYQVGVEGKSAKK